jgi:ABC-type Zn uptake system ZnuABC Zn-binding protein ZnuA
MGGTTRVGVCAAVVALVLLGACGGSSSDDGGAPADDIDQQPGAAAECGAGVAVEGRPLRIATTVAPITSIVANVVGDAAEVTGLVPEGTNSHTFEPPPSVAATLAEADVVFANGLVLEEPTKDLARSNLPGGSILCELGTTVLPAEEYIYDFSFPKEAGKPNPHLWTDPTLARRYVELVRDVVVRLDPANAAVFRANAQAYLARIDVLDDAVRTATDTLPADQRQLLTYHDAYAYFARTYGWTVIGAIQPSSFDEPTSKDIVRLIQQVERSGVKAIFGSEVFPSAVLEQIGSETGVQYVDELRDDDLPGVPGDPDHSFLGLMVFDYVTMVSALGGDPSAIELVDVSDVTPDTARYPQ